MILRHLGYKVYPAYNGRDGLTAARTSKPDIIFCDINLPDLSGIEVARNLRNSTSRESFMVALSGALELSRIDYIDLYFDWYAAKPVRTSILHEILKVAEARKSV
jgi:DNA-binding response OmpR family regulator